MIGESREFAFLNSKAPRLEGLFVIWGALLLYGNQWFRKSIIL